MSIKVKSRKMRSTEESEERAGQLIQQIALLLNLNIDGLNHIYDAVQLVCQHPAYIKNNSDED